MRNRILSVLLACMLCMVSDQMPCMAEMVEQEMEPVAVNEIVCDKTMDWDHLVIVSDKQAHFVYTRNDTRSDAVAQMSSGAAAEIIGENGNWYFVRSGIYKGFLKKSSGLLKGRAAEKFAYKQFDKQAKVTKGTVFVYGWQKNGGKQDYVIGVLAKDDVIRLGRQTDDGYLVSVSGVQGIVDFQEVHASVVLDGATEPDVCELTNQLDNALGTYGDEQSYDYAQNLVPHMDEDDAAADQGDAFLSLVNYAKMFLGNPYVWGGESLTDGVDCSGFIMKLYEHYGISLPHSSYLMRSCGGAVTDGYFDEELSLPGDIVCYEGHVALYIGDGKIIHASNPRDGIKISDVNYRSDLICVRRISVGHGIWSGVSDADFSALCRIVETEAGGCSLQEKIYVADVVLNRVQSPRFAQTSITGIITAPGQFQPVTNGRWQKAQPSAQSVYAARYALEHNDSSMGALYFMNPKLSDPKNVTWFQNSLKYLFMIDETAFFR